MIVRNRHHFVANRRVLWFSKRRNIYESVHQGLGLMDIVLWDICEIEHKVESKFRLWGIPSWLATHPNFP